MNTTKGFTVIELLVVVSVIGILASLIIPPTVRALKFSRQKLHWAELSQNARLNAAMDENNDTNALRILSMGIGSPSMWDIKTLGR